MNMKELIRNKLSKNNHDKCTVINTCAVTQEAVRKSKKAVTKAIKDNQNHCKSMKINEHQ